MNIRQASEIVVRTFTKPEQPSWKRVPMRDDLDVMALNENDRVIIMENGNEYYATIHYVWESIQGPLAQVTLRARNGDLIPPRFWTISTSRIDYAIRWQ